MPMRKGERESLSELISQEPLVPPRTELTGSDGFMAVALKRSDSYKQATSKENRISVLFGSNSDFNKKDYDKEKYRTLPSQIGTVRLTSRATSGQRQKRSSDTRMFDRQESGIVPSPDTDEDQKSSGSARKKKSRLQKVKERILHSFQRQTITETERLHRKRERQERQRTARVRKKKKKMKSSSLEVIQEQTEMPQSRLKRIFSFRRPRKVYAGDEDHSKSTTGKAEGDTKNIGTPGARGAGVSIHPQDNVDGTLNPVDAVFKSMIFGEISRDNSTTGERKEHAPARTDKGGLSLDLSSPNRGRHRLVRRITSREEVKEQVVNGSFRSQRETRYSRQVSLYSDVEVDGDETDAPDTTEKHKKDGRPFEVLSEEEKEHRIAEVASRLKLIGDKAVERYNTESSSSGLESPQGQGPTARADDQLVQQLVEEFRKEGDRFSREYKLGSLTPVVLDIARQHTYAQFRHVVHSSLQHSVGWEQIALYFYLTRTAVHVAKGSVSVAQMAYQYFRETYSGWVEERGGWETMLEETDCELD